MQNVTLDFESKYDPATGFSLSSMSTENYCGDERFDTILFSWMVDDGEPNWFSGDKQSTRERLLSLELHKKALTGHHARFDASVLAQQFQIFPKHLYCTEYMANPTLKPRLKSLSLKSLAEHLGLPPKGDEVMFVQGMGREDFSPQALERYAKYCMHDTWLCRQIFLKLYPRLSADELRVLDFAIRMYTQPQLHLDESAFRTGLRITQERKAKMVAEQEVQGITKKMLSSGQQFAQILRDRGIDPPMKESPTWLKKPEAERELCPEKRWTYAFGKTDTEFLQLKEDFAEDPEISALLAARTESKSTIEESRCERYIEKSRHKVLRAAVVYAGAHTGRFTADEKENVLNMPNIGAHVGADGQTAYKSMLRFGFVAPPGHVVVGIDYAQIEARLAAVLAGQNDLVEGFRAGVDVYSVFAESLYGRPVSKALAKTDPQADRDRNSAKITLLGSQYGLGPAKFRRFARAQGLTLTEEEAERIIRFYRAKYSSIPELWGQYTAAVNDLIQYREDISIGPVRFTWDTPEDAAIILPGGRRLLYPGLHAVQNKVTGRADPTFRRARDKWPQRIWGGSCLENICQALSYNIISRDMVAIHRELLGVRPALQVYDEILFSIPEDEAEEFRDMACEIMTRPVEWLPDLPIAVEAKIGASYGAV